MKVTVKGGTTLKQVNHYLNEQGLAMKNLGSISEQTVAGAISTGIYDSCIRDTIVCMCVCVHARLAGTHGNGIGFGNLAMLVTRLEFVNGMGEVKILYAHTCTRTHAHSYS